MTIFTSSGHSETRVFAMPRWRMQVSASPSRGEVGRSRLERSGGEGKPGGEESTKRPERAARQADGKGERVGEGESRWRLGKRFPRFSQIPPCFPAVANLFGSFGVFWVSGKVTTAAHKAKEKPGEAPG